MKNVFFIVFLFVFSSTIFSQKKDFLSIGLESNSQYYTDDKKTGDFTEDNRFRSNNYLKIDYSYSNFFVGLQAESYEPGALLNYPPGFDKTNLGLYYAGYSSEKIKVTAGYFYEQFGSGLILRFWEDRQLGINNALRGGKVSYSPTESLSFTALYGKQRDGFDVSEGTISGFDVTLDVSNLLKIESSNLSLGFSYVGRDQAIETANPDYTEKTNAFSGRLDYSKNSFYSGVEYVSKSNDAVILFGQVRNSKPGSALLFNLGYAKKGFGIDATFRRIENMTFYSEREAAGNVFNQNIINYVPALTKQHDYLLTNIYVYQAQPQVSFQDVTLTKAGEIGGQIDLFYTFKKKSSLGGKYGTKIALNASYWSGLKGDYDFTTYEYETDFLGSGEKYFSDISFEVRKKWSKEWSSIFYLVNQYYNKRYVEETVGEVNSTIIVGESTYKLGSGKVLRFEAQHLWTKDDRKNWVGGTVELSINSKLGFYINDIYNYGSDDSNDQIHYYNIGGNYVLGAHRFTLNYGRQRGGLICVGGVCRFVPESTGFSASFALAF
ncbi:MAG: hypothetical protein JXR05_07705 [Flavobacteriaceae bacterium]